MQRTAPLINSEYGGVSAGGGDRDVSWGFRDLTTQLRRHSKIQGYVYTELTDIEWEHNGFADYDRTPKEFGYEAFVPGMTVADLQGADFVGYDAPPAIVAKPGETITRPRSSSATSPIEKAPPSCAGGSSGVDDRADLIMAAEPESRPIEWTPYDVRQLEPVKVRMPMRPFVGAIVLTLATRTTGGSRPTTSMSSSGPSGPCPGSSVEATARSSSDSPPVRSPRSQWTGPAASPGGKCTARARDSSSIA